MRHEYEFTFDVEILGGINICGTAIHDGRYITEIELPDGSRILGGLIGQAASASTPHQCALWQMITAELLRGRHYRDRMAEQRYAVA